MRRGMVSMVLVVACVAATITVGSRRAPVAAQGEPAPAVERMVPGAGTPRPRAVYEPGTEDDLAARLEREPYRSIFLEAHALHEARRLSRTPGDPDRHAQKDMARAARWLAFTYAIDRTVLGGEIVPFPDESSRLEVGAIVEELLLGLYDRSRFAVPLRRSEDGIATSTRPERSSSGPARSTRCSAPGSRSVRRTESPTTK